MTDSEFMQAALIEAAHAGDAGEVPIGAVVVHNGKIIGRGRNACERLQDATAHAEIVALTAASNIWVMAARRLYVVLHH